MYSHVEEFDAWVGEVKNYASDGRFENLQAAMADPRMNLQIKCDAFRAALDGLQTETAIYLAERLQGEPLDDIVAREVAVLLPTDLEAFAAGIRDSQLSASAKRTAICAAFDYFDEPDVLGLLRDPAFTPSEPNLLFLKAIASGDHAKVAQALADPLVQPGQDGNMPLKLAVFAGDVAVVKMLLRDARVDIRDREFVFFCSL